MPDVPSELRFPIGEFIPPDRVTDEQVAATNVGIYAWHGLHHLAHITSLARRAGWRLDLEGVPS